MFRLIRSHLFLVAATFLHACATPDAVLPDADVSLVGAEAKAVQRLAVEDALAREERVRRLAWPIVSENAELCPRTGPKLGWRIGDDETVQRLAKGLKKRQVTALGWTDQPRLLSVAPGSPADQAGLKPGDHILGIAGEEDSKSLKQLGKSLSKALEDWEDRTSLTIAARRGGDRFEAEVTPVRACDVRIISSASRSLNAHASFSEMVIYAGLLRAFPEDNDVAFVIAHELAHITGRHARKGTRNGIVTGAVLWAPPSLILAGAFDWLTAWPAEKLGAQAPPLSTAVTQAAAASVNSVAFEREADYVGLYMHVRAGGSLDGLENVFETFGKVGPRTSWLKVSHPIVPERLVHLQQTSEELRAKQANGAPLIPEGLTVEERKR